MEDDVEAEVDRLAREICEEMQRIPDVQSSQTSPVANAPPRPPSLSSNGSPPSSMPEAPSSPASNSDLYSLSALAYSSYSGHDAGYGEKKHIEREQAPVPWSSQSVPRPQQGVDKPEIQPLPSHHSTEAGHVTHAQSYQDDQDYHPPAGSPPPLYSSTDGLAQHLRFSGMSADSGSKDSDNLESAIRAAMYSRLEDRIKDLEKQVRGCVSAS